MLYPWVKQANRVFFAVFIVQFVMSLILGAVYEQWTQAILGSILIAAVPMALLKLAPTAQSTHIAVGVAVQLMAALHIQMAQGLTEMHFEIFSFLALLSIYRDWKVLLASVATVAVHHFLFFFVQISGGGLYVLEPGHVTFALLMVHAFFAVFEGAILMWVAKTIRQEALASFILSKSVHDILQPDGTVDLTIKTEGDVEELSDFNHLVNSFKKLIGESKAIGDEACMLSMKAEELSNALVKDVEAGSEQVHSIASSIEEMSVTNQDVAQRASENSQLSTENSQSTKDAIETIERSSADSNELNNLLQDTSETIEQLSEMCTKIDSAMHSIKTISEQTNLLALNAAIESARAGEHGRGFAVVADEVRQLATTSGQNAEEISSITATLIKEATDAVGKVRLCVETAERTAESSRVAVERIDAINKNTAKLDSNIDSVATAAEEQSVVSNTIAAASQKLMDSSTQQANHVSQSNEALGKLVKRIGDLQNELQRFAV